MRYLFLGLTKRSASLDQQLVLASPATRTDPVSIVRCVSPSAAGRLEFWEEFLGWLVSGDQIIVASAWVFGDKGDEIPERIRSILDLGVSLKVLDMDATFDKQALSFLHLLDMIQPRKGVNGKIPEGRMDEARAMWFDARVTMTEVIAELGVSQKTLYRHFGPRGRSVRSPEADVTHHG